MLLTVKDACELHPMALDYSMSEQVENLSDVIAARAATARDFFDKNYVTRGMETLLTQGLRRLGGKSDQAVFELAREAAFGNASLVALNGRLGFEETFVWGEIANQLGKGPQFSRFWRDGATAHRKRMTRTWCGSERSKPSSGTTCRVGRTRAWSPIWQSSPATRPTSRSGPAAGLAGIICSMPASCSV